MRLAHLSFLATLLLTGCGSSLGNETYEIALAYGEGSNHGPQDATGSATVSGGSGQVDIEVRGLPTLSAERYEGWLAGGGETALSTGCFNTDADGGGSSTIVLGDISGTSFEKVVITVEPEPDSDPGPDPRHSIEGPIE